MDGRVNPLTDYDLWTLQNREDADDQRRLLVEEDYYDRADRLYQAWKEGDL